MKRVLLGLLGAILVLALVGYALRTTIMRRMIPRVVEQNLTTNLLDRLPDGLHVVLCGAGSPLPDPKRSGPCAAVIAGDKLFIVDSGSGSSRMLSQLRIPQGRIDGILLTHFHSDHIDGLGELLLQRWVTGGHTIPTPVHGPDGVEAIVDGFNQAYAMDATFRVAHHGDEIVPASGAGGVARPFRQPIEGVAMRILSEDTFSVMAFRVDHDPVDPAVAYRFFYQGRSIVLSGDTKKNDNLRLYSKSADVLVHEALSPELVGYLTAGAEAAGNQSIAKITNDILDYHASPVEAAETAKEAGVGHLLFYHIVPPLLFEPMEAIFLEGVSDAYDGPVTLGRDGTMISLPAGSKEILVEQLL
jgi:ribonuclease Z